MILLVISILVFIAYSILIFYFWRSWTALPPFEVAGKDGNDRVSVIIPARNEEKNIGDLLEALQLQLFPAGHFEVIVIDDDSEDATAEIVRKYPEARLVSLRGIKMNSYKKKAIESGIAVATGDLILTTDADCLPGMNWLRAVTSFKKMKNAIAVAGPVSINCNNSLLQIFQSLDMMVMQGITGGAIYRDKLSLCNGANFAYEKSAFYEVNGFRDIDMIASGDDMLLLFKLRNKYPGRVHYLKSRQAIVATEPMKTWKEFFNQRIRWASKARKYQDKRILPVLALVYLFNLLFLVLLIAGFFEPRYWLLALGLLIAKTITEFPFFISLCRFFDKRWAIKLFIFFQPLHIFYTIVAGLFGQLGKYEWKGRKIK